MSSLVCGEPKFEHSTLDTSLNPMLLVEVLSSSTEPHDRGVKARGTRLIDSLSEYLLIAENECRIEQTTRQPNNRWLLSDIRSAEEMIQLESINCELAVIDLYDKVPDIRAASNETSGHKRNS